ncbi:PPK2 family polyphosphate kinase [Demequina aurantiaca]|uniref:PPK2 family polyphosphate kinase n=1 Tax=Demequina aurantiaca TaxID=676200 RepID=UPI0007836C77|nr:PPK2 family polyphosphate kinase [Demequina aurantiaca]
MSRNYSDLRDHPSAALRVPPGFSIAGFDKHSTPGFDGNKEDGIERMEARGRDLAILQEQLFAEGRSGGRRSVLLVLQGMDTAGKGGIVRHVIGMVDPQGVEHASFAAPTKEELSHHFLWRIERKIPSAGSIGVFDRSHYEDVLVAKVREFAPPEEIEARYGEINEWEQRLIDHGTTIVKATLLVSLDEQLDRLESRLHRPDKYWKYSTSDLDDRARWTDYRDAYEAMFERTSTDAAPWHVIPADRKWFARLAMTELLCEALEGMSLQWPPAAFDVDAERARIDVLREAGK